MGGSVANTKTSSGRRFSLLGQQRVPGPHTHCTAHLLYSSYYIAPFSVLYELFICIFKPVRGIIDLGANGGHPYEMSS